MRWVRSLCAAICAAILALVSLTGLLTNVDTHALSDPSADHPFAVGERAVVLGGGGLTGQAWQIGMLKGLRDSGVDLTQADLVIGTSGGSVAATQMRSGFLDAFYAALLGAPVLDSSLEDIDLAYFEETARMWQGVESTEALRIAVGSRALEATQVIAEDAFIERTATRVGLNEWPALPLQITTVDVFDGTLRLIDHTQGISIAEAVAASTAQPAIAAPISLGSSRYMDGGLAGSPIDVAVGHRRVVALIPGGGLVTERAAAAARDEGVALMLLGPDAESAQARGPVSQDPARMRMSAEAGQRQGALVAGDVLAFWAGSADGQ